MIHIVNLHTYKKGDVVRADRRTQFGNPFRIGRDGNRTRVIYKHKRWLMRWLRHGEEIVIDGYSNKWVCQNVNRLYDKTVGCWCKPLACHVDNLAWLLGRTQC